MPTRRQRGFHRLPLSLVGGHLEYDGLAIHACDSIGRLDADTRKALIERYPDVEPHSYRGGKGIDYSWWSVRHLRIHQCRQCQAYYIAHWHCTFCSDGCAVEYRRPTNTALKQKRRKSDREYRLRNEVPYFCEHCDGKMPDAQRMSKRFCSDKCRKAAKRKAVAELSLV